MNTTLRYYDLVLAGVLVSLLLGLGVGWLSPYSLSVTVPLFAVVAIAIIGHGLFVNGPVDEPADLRDEADVLD